MAKHYCDYIHVWEEYNPIMSKAVIEKKPDAWLDFYPHKKYLDFLRKLLDQLANGTKSVWLYGNYGTGKSHAALTTWKLFMDDDQERVEKWFNSDRYTIPDKETLKRDLLKYRKETLVVYDYNASGLKPHKEFLVRLEKSIQKALSDAGFQCPASSSLDNVIRRVEEEGERFFVARDKIQSQLTYLTPDIKTTSDLVSRLRLDPHDLDSSDRLLSEVDAVLQSNSIYLDIDVTSFRKWINEVLKVNKLKQVVFIFDEFSEFLDNNKTNLKTLEDVTESPGFNHFYFVPVTHLRMEAFLGYNQPGANRAKFRFDFCELQMPSNTALELAGDAIKIKDGMKEEWLSERKNLIASISGLTDKFNDSQTEIKEESFFKILPVHPMAAFLLKFLSESLQSNQRSIFEYLKGSANGHEFQNFLKQGGPSIFNHQLLTVDYLWTYFIERDDTKLGDNKDIQKVRFEYNRIQNLYYRNSSDDDQYLRVLRTVMLLWLIERNVTDGHERLKATVDNVKLSFVGTAISGIDDILENLARQHCISISNKSIELFGMSDTDNQEIEDEISRLQSKFDDCISSTVKANITEKLKPVTQKFSISRFDVCVTDTDHVHQNYLNTSTRDNCSNGLKNDDGSICLWFIVSKTHDDELNIESKATKLLEHFEGHRILLLSFSNQSFCESDVNHWNDYIRLRAKYNKESHNNTKINLKKQFTKFEDDWINKLKRENQTLKLYQWNSNQLEIKNLSWEELNSYLPEYLQQTMPRCIDYLAQGKVTSFKNDRLSIYAKAGITFEFTGKNSGEEVLTKKFINQGIEKDSQWYNMHVDHPLTEIHNHLISLFEKNISSGKKFQLRQAYLELKRSPYGMRNNNLSAFVLGFALKEILEKDYQWSDGRQSYPLNIESLGEIIEAVVKDDGKGDIKNEKLICRLKKKKKAFLKYMPQLFGLKKDESHSLEAVISQVGNQIMAISQRVPLWTLEEYIQIQDFTNAEMMIEILNKLCIIEQTSASKKNNEYTESIKFIGKNLNENPDLIHDLSSCLKPECFIQAFQIYVDKQRPEFASLAQSVNDLSCQYCNEVLKETAAKSGLLWNKQDISELLDQTIAQYKVIRLVQNLTHSDMYLSYDSEFNSALKVLTNAVKTNCSLPQLWIKEQHPTLSAFLDYVVLPNENPENVLMTLEPNLELVRTLFFDSSKKAQLDILRNHFPDTMLDDSTLRTELSKAPADMSPSEFADYFQNRIEELASASIANQLLLRWKEFSGCNTPDQWAKDNSIPVRYLLRNCEQARSVIKAVNTPSALSSKGIQECLEILNSLSPAPVKDCQNAFLKDMIPKKYAMFNIDLGSLISFLKAKEGSNPNDWSEHPDLTEFIEQQYQTTCAPQIVEKIRSMSAEELKHKVIDLARKNQDLGILFWE